MLRLGEISFINALPLSLPDSVIGEMPVHKSVLPPTALNRAMANNDLDISPVSSAFYLRHQDQLVLLDDLSISAERPVESVLLFLPMHWEGLAPEGTIAVPNTSETSIALMQYIIYRQTSYEPASQVLTTYAPGEGQRLLDAGQPILAIGDEALTLKQTYPDVPAVDLAEAWYHLTELPFVFAVWVAQKDWALQHPEQLAMVNQRLAEQKAQFMMNPDIQTRVVEQARQRCPHLDTSLIRHYFLSALSYNLDDRHHMALSWFGHIISWLDHDTIHLPDGDSPQLPVELLLR